MPTLPPEATDSPTTLAIYKAYEKKREKEPRRYLGASVIGKPCARALWYEFRWAGQEEFSGRMLRLFETGTMEEARFLYNLQQIGCEVYAVDPETKEQVAVSDLSGHFRGHLDGMVKGIPEAPAKWHVLEAKTHNAKSFATLRNKGVREAKPEHFAQMMVYMHLTKVDRALYMACNKDTSEIYTERVKYDFAEASRIRAIATDIITAQEAPARVGGPDSFACKWCTHRARCHASEPKAAAVPCNVNCRTCAHSTARIEEGDNNAPWACDLHHKKLSEQEQAAGCEDHIFIPDLVLFADPIDGTEKAVTYRNRGGGQVWTNGSGSDCYSSAELASAPTEAIGNPQVSAVKLTLGGKIIKDGAPC